MCSSDLKGQSLPGKVFKSKTDAVIVDMQKESPPDALFDSRQELAKRHGVRGCFALWRDGAVFEFGASRPFGQAGGEAGRKPALQSASCCAVGARQRLALCPLMQMHPRLALLHRTLADNAC